MTQQLDGKVAVITGGSSGIGKATALAFAREGAKVAIGARRESEGEAVAQEIRDAGGEAVFVKTDVTDPAQVEALVQAAVDTYGQLDIAFNNAGTEGDRLSPIVEDSEENIRRIFDVNVLGVWHSMRAQIPHLVERGGSIINNSSVAGRRGFGAFSAYVASKYAVEGLSRSVAQELAASKVRVNTVAPGPIDTALLDRATGGDPSGFVGMVPMGRTGQPDEIAAAVVFLASDAASYVTSQSIAVDGGMLA
jgi:NAD(P)-dependent dehydrogenase (short-subunit alcohol dehydrogenase family)